MTTTEPTEAAAERTDRPVGLRAIVGSRYAAIWFALAGLLVVSFILAPGSVGASSIYTMLPFAAVLAIAACGQSFVIRQSGLDLSVPGSMSLACAVFTRYSDTDDSRIAMGFVLAMLAVTVVGVLNGIATTLLGINSFVATLATNALAIGTVQFVTGNVPTTSPQAWSAFALQRTLGIPNVVLIAVVIVAVGTILAARTVAGRRATAIGANPNTARVVGLPVAGYQMGSFVIAAWSYGLAGLLLAGFLQTPGLNIGADYLLPAIAAVVLGGSPLAGGRSSLVATVGGAIFLTQLGQLVLSVGAPTSLQYLIQASIIALGVTLPAIRWTRGLRTRFRAPRTLREAHNPNERQAP